MEETNVYNSLRALDLREADGTPTFTGDDRETILTSLCDTLTAEWPTERKQNKVNYILDVLGRTDGQGTSLLTGTRREAMKQQLISLF
jgi:hypothetical protein